MKRALAVPCLVLLAACTAPPARDAIPEPNQTPDPRPNVLVIVTDDQRADTLDVMPATRRLFGDRGTTFTNAFATTPLCCPARASIFTGRYPHNHGVLRNKQSHDLDTTTTLQYYFRQETDYRTGLVGKYLNSWTVEEDPPHFDYWASYSGRYYGKPFNVNGTVTATDDYSTYYMARKAQRFIRTSEAQDERPWFLYVATVAPHEPYTIAPQHRGARVPPWDRNPAIGEADLSDKPEYQPRPFEPANPDLLRRKQLRTLLAVDDLVAKIASSLRENGEAATTLAFYTSDNGMLWGEHGHFAKRLPYTASIAIPLLVRWPGYFDGGTSDDSLVGNVDVAPTIMEAAGLIPDERYPVDGIPLGGTPRGEIYLEQLDNWRVGLPDWRSIRSADFQYVEYYAREGERVIAREYYDLVEDPWQLRNLLGDDDPGNDPDVTALSDRLADYAQCAGEECGLSRGGDHPS